MKQIEVEGGEISLKNSHGDIVIIPKNKASWVKQKLSEGCHGCIDSLVESLPSMRDYAEDGGIYPPEYELMSKVLSQRNKNLNWVDRGLNPDNYGKIDNKDGSFSTHRLAYSTGDHGEAYVYPTIIQNDKGELEELTDEAARNYAFKTKSEFLNSHSGLNCSINQSFFFLLHFFNCFSLAIAFCIC